MYNTMSEHTVKKIVLRNNSKASKQCVFKYLIISTTLFLIFYRWEIVEGVVACTLDLHKGN